MSGAMNEFLIWFDGWSENIGRSPTPKQWERLRLKVEQMRMAQPAGQTVSTPAGSVTAEAAATAKPSKPKAWTRQSWEAAFVAALEELGFDAESARDVMEGVTFNPQTDPAQAARSATAGMMN